MLCELLVGYSCQCLLDIMQVLDAQCWVVFFSPSGVQFVLDILKSYSDIQVVKVHCDKVLSYTILYVP